MGKHVETLPSLFDGQIINKLVSVLAEHGYSERDYSLSGYAEMKRCMEKAEGGYCSC